MEENLKNEILRLINLKVTNKYDVKSMVNIIRDNIDKRFNVCVHCAAQIKFAQRQLENCYKLQNQEPINNPPTITQEPGCQKCKKKRSSKS